MLNKYHHNASILKKKKELYRLRLLDTHTYHMILNSGDSTIIFHTAVHDGSFYYGVTQHALQHEAFC